MKLSLLSTGAETGARFIEYVKLAELLGFHTFLHSDRDGTRDAMTRLGAASQCTTRLGLGIWVTDPSARHPALLARAAATLAEMAPGRLRVVVTQGRAETLPGAAGPPPLVSLQETVALMRRLWRGEAATLDGEAMKFKGGPLAWKPTAIPMLYVAAREPHILKLAGSVADGVMMEGFASADGFESAKQHVLSGLQAAGRNWKDIRLCSYVPVAVLDREGDPVPDAIRREASAAFASNQSKLSAMADLLAPDGTTPRGLIDSFAVVGTGEQALERLKALAEAGVDEIVISPYPAQGQDIEDFMFRLVKDFMPHLSEPPAARAS